MANNALITITADSNTKMYDGTALTDNGYTYTGFLSWGDHIDSVTVVGEQTHYGETANVVTGYVIKNWRGEDVTDSYTNVQTVNGTLSITKRDVTLTSASDSQKYDGTALTNDTITVTGSGFVSGEGATYNVTGSQTNAGSSKNYFSYDLNAGTYSADYAITTTEGTLTVYTADAITITADSNSKKYDGKALTDSGYVVSGKLLPGNYVGDVVVTGSLTDAGTAANKVTSYKIYNAQGQDVTANYAKANLVDGTLTVTTRSVTITSDSDSKVYDGTPLTKNSTRISGGDGFVGGEGYTATVTGSQTVAGIGKNTFTVSAATGTNLNNYNITKVAGDLTVTPAAAITITANSSTKVYDGTALTDSGYTYTGKLMDGDYLSVTVSGSQTNAGVAANKVTSYKIYNAAGEDVTSSYAQAELINGALTVEKRTITIDAGSASKVYDGTALTCDTWTCNDLVANEKISNITMTADSTIKHVGSTANKIADSSITITKADGTDSSMNYNIICEEGTLTVTKRNVLLISTDAEKYYDGTALQNRQVIVTGLSYLDGEAVQGEGFLPGDGCTYDFVGDNVVIDAAGNIISWTVSEQSDTAYGQTDVGTSKNEFNYHNFTSVYAGSYENDYEIIYGNAVPQWFIDKYGQEAADDLFGDLTVWGGPVEIDMTDYSWTYDYQAKSNGYFDDGYTIVFTTDEEGAEETITTFDHNSEGHAVALCGDDVIVVTVTGQGGSVDSGKVQHVVNSDGTTSKQNTATYKIYRDGYDVTDEVAEFYQISISGGTLKITPRDVELVSGDATKRYDGTALTDNTVTEGSKGILEGFIFGEGAAYEVTGSQTAVGTSENTFKISKWLPDTKATDYNVTMTNGTLTVTKGAQSDIDSTNISDVVFQWTGGDGQIGYWMNGTNEWKVGGTGAIDSNWSAVAVADMNCDAEADVIMAGEFSTGWGPWRRESTSIGYYESGDGSKWVSLGSYSAGDVEIKTGNLTGNDNANSVILHSATTQELVVWEDGDSTKSTVLGNFDESWTLNGAADFDGDSKDVVVMTCKQGDVGGFYTVDMEGNVEAIANFGLAWDVCAIGDFNSNGKDDLVIYCKDLGVVAKLTDGIADTFEVLGQLDADDWFVVGAGDYNGDQIDDLLVRQYSTGMLGYYSNGDMDKWNELGRGVDMNWAVIA